MRVLVSCLSSSGHFHPMVPLARALERAGHEVAFAVSAPFLPAVEANGFRGFAAGVGFESLGMNPQEIQQRQAAMRQASSTQMMERFMGMFLDNFARRKVPDLMEICERWRPDLLVHESMECAAAIVGEKRGLPYAAVQVGGGNMMVREPEMFARHLDAIRAEVGLAPDPRFEALSRYLHLSFMPASFFSVPLPRTARYVRMELFDQSGTEGLPEWARSFGSRPVVYATLGTVFNKFIHHLGTIAEGLRDEPLELILTVGRDQDPAQLGPQPANVHVERYIPQSLLLPSCDLAIMHGGYNSVMSAVAAGVPVIVVPLAADQPMNAEACARLGMGRVVEPDKLTPEFIRQQAREVLKDGSYRERARRIQAEAAALPGMDHALGLLETLARDKRPVTEG